MLRLHLLNLVFIEFLRGGMMNILQTVHLLWTLKRKLNQRKSVSYTKFVFK